MVKSKYQKNFIYQAGPSPLHPKGSFPGIPLIRVDDSYMKGAFYFECIWQTGPINETGAYKPHSHDFDEYVGFFSGNVEDPFNLGAEVQFYMNDEMYTFTKNCLIYVPAGTWHGPVMVKKLTRPVFCLSTSPMTRYHQKINKDPKWAHLADPPESDQ